MPRRTLGYLLPGRRGDSRGARHRPCLVFGFVTRSLWPIDVAIGLSIAPGPLAIAGTVLLVTAWAR